MTRRFIVAALVVCSLTIVTASAFGQAVYGSIFGTVTDPSGAAVSGAKVTVTSVRKNITEQATTNADGNYSITHLIPDVYTVKAEAPGFKSFQTANVVVSADTGSRVDGQFQVGGSQETVEVTAEAPQLKTDRADVAAVFYKKQGEDLLLFYRKFSQVLFYFPGLPQKFLKPVRARN